MARRAERHGGEPPSGNVPTGYGWLRPGYLAMPSAANDNRITPRRLLRLPSFWGWLAMIGLALTLLAVRI